MKTYDDYLEAHSSEHTPLMHELYRHTNLTQPYAHMLSCGRRAILLSFLADMIQPKAILEIGTFTGYSAMAMLRFLPQTTTLHTIEASDEIAETAQTFLQKLPHNIKIFIGDALEVLPSLNQTYDLIFIDACKDHYQAYYDLAFPLLKLGGYFLVDNVLWYDKVPDERFTDKTTLNLRRFNDYIASDHRTHQTILPDGDGLMLIRKTSAV